MDASRQVELLKEVLEAYRAEYTDLAQVWASTEAKAQNTIATGGIFIGALVAFATKVGRSLDVLDQVSLLAATLALVLTVVVAILSLRVRYVVAPPLGANTATLVRDFLENIPSNELDARLPALRHDQIKEWQLVVSALEQAVAAKIGLVQLAQYCLFAAILAAATYLLRLLLA